MSKSNVVAFSGLGAIADPLTELLRRGARALIQQAAEAELSEFLGRFPYLSTPPNSQASAFCVTLCNAGR